MMFWFKSLSVGTELNKDIDQVMQSLTVVCIILLFTQGLFIFAFHCVGNSEVSLPHPSLVVTILSKQSFFVIFLQVRVAYKRLHEKRTLAKSLPEHSLSSSHNGRVSLLSEKYFSAFDCSRYHLLSFLTLAGFRYLLIVERIIIIPLGLCILHFIE